MTRGGLSMSNPRSDFSVVRERSTYTNTQLLTHMAGKLLLVLFRPVKAVDSPLPGSNAGVTQQHGWTPRKNLHHLINWNWAVTRGDRDTRRPGQGAQRGECAKEGVAPWHTHRFETYSFILTALLPTQMHTYRTLEGRLRKFSKPAAPHQCRRILPHAW